MAVAQWLQWQRWQQWWQPKRSKRQAVFVLFIGLEVRRMYEKLVLHLRASDTSLKSRRLIMCRPSQVGISESSWALPAHSPGKCDGTQHGGFECERNRWTDVFCDSSELGASHKNPAKSSRAMLEVEVVEGEVLGHPPLSHLGHPPLSYPPKTPPKRNGNQRHRWSCTKIREVRRENGSHWQCSTPVPWLRWPPASRTKCQDLLAHSRTDILRSYQDWRKPNLLTRLPLRSKQRLGRSLLAINNSAHG